MFKFQENKFKIVQKNFWEIIIKIIIIIIMIIIIIIKTSWKSHCLK